MKQYFYDLTDFLKTHLTGNEVFLANLSGENSDFCRLNNSKVRQGGTVFQWQLSIKLVDGAKNVDGDVILSCNKEDDQKRVETLLNTLRNRLPAVLDDPHLLYSTEINSTESIGENTLSDSRGVVSEILDASAKYDLVGIYASGGIFRGFANSLGQKNWHENYNFNFDWSLYLRDDKAVKCSYAGFKWDSEKFINKLATYGQQLELLAKEPKTIKPGKYRAYLAPAALSEFVEMLAWRGFGLQGIKTKQTPLLKLTDGDVSLNTAVTITENSAGGIAPRFNSSGFIKPGKVNLIEGGKFADSLVSARSAKEYGVEQNGSNEHEFPESIEFSTGTIKQADILSTLQDGVYINNLWYLNFSDVTACRITGMTRFASFWVEGGEIVAPLNVMRFDESVYKMLGSNLVGLTDERDFMMSPGSYDWRETGSCDLPGLIADDFSFTL